jgi:hypothetical protein
MIRNAPLGRSRGECCNLQGPQSRWAKRVVIAVLIVSFVGISVWMLVPSGLKAFFLLLAGVALFSMRMKVFKGSAAGGVPFSKTRFGVVSFVFLPRVAYLMTGNEFRTLLRKVGGEQQVAVTRDSIRRAWRTHNELQRRTKGD